MQLIVPARNASSNNFLSAFVKPKEKYIFLKKYHKITTFYVSY